MMDGAALLPVAAPEWAEVLTEVSHDVYHCPEYVAFDASNGGPLGPGEPCAFTYREGARVLLLPLVLRAVPGSTHLDATSPYGYPGPVSNAPWDDEGFWRRCCAALVATLAGRGVIACFVRLHPLLVPRLDTLGRHGTVVQHGRTVVIDLTLTDEQSWSQVRGNHRRGINQARRRGTVASIDDWSRLAEFVDIYHETMRRVEATDYYFFPAEYFTGLREAVGSDVHLVVVDDGGEPIGGGLFFERDGIVQYHLGGTRTSALPLQPTKLVFDEVRRWARSRGDEALHLGGGVGGRVNPLFHFKAGFSTDHPPFFTWRAVIDPTAYAAQLEHLPGGAPDHDDGYFPAYRRPRS